MIAWEVRGLPILRGEEGRKGRERKGRVRRGEYWEEGSVIRM